MPLLKPILTLLVAAAIAGGTYAVTRMSPQEPAAADQRRGRTGAGGPVSVVAGEARLADVPVFIDGVGSAKARNSIAVRPQLDGRLISIKFKEGQDVKKGDLLAKIDPVTYQAQLDQALAKKTVDESQLANIKRDLARFEKVGTLAISEKQIDTQRALAIQQEAQIKSDNASIDNLTAILGYTNILAPIDGRVGRIRPPCIRNNAASCARCVVYIDFTTLMLSTTFAKCGNISDSSIPDCPCLANL